MNQNTIELEAAAFRRLLAHFQEHTEVQNIDLMLVGDFCRNCLAKWYAEAAAERGITVGYEQAREVVYGMPYPVWKDRFQQETSPEKLAAFNAKQALKAAQ